MTYHENGGKHELAWLTNLVKIITLFLLKFTPHAWYRWIAGNIYLIFIIGCLCFWVRKTCQKIKKLHFSLIFHKDEVTSPLLTTSRKIQPYYKKVQTMSFIFQPVTPLLWLNLFALERFFWKNRFFAIFEKVSIFVL